MIYLQSYGYISQIKGLPWSGLHQGTYLTIIITTRHSGKTIRKWVSLRVMFGPDPCL